MKLSYRSVGQIFSHIEKQVSSRFISRRYFVYNSSSLPSTLSLDKARFPGSTRSQSTSPAVKPFSAFLTDSFARQHNYLRISITERCNLRCIYCMPAEGVELSPSDRLLTTPEIAYLAQLFVRQGVSKIRLTGGEPTVRRDIVGLIQILGKLRARGLRELCLTTNGVTLERKLEGMVEAGLTGVNLSLDTLDPWQYVLITRRKGLEAVLKGLARMEEMNRAGAKIKIKVNCVVMRGINEGEIVKFVELTRERDIEVRFIEYMPFDGNRWAKEKMVPYQEMLKLIRGAHPALSRAHDGANDTSKTWHIPGFMGRLGFVTSMTDNFCAGCNRLRVTSDGNLKVCLFDEKEVSLRDLLREGNDGQPLDQEAMGKMSKESDGRRNEREARLLNVIGKAVGKKKARHAGMGSLEHMKNRPMILIDDTISRYDWTLQPASFYNRPQRSWNAAMLVPHLARRILPTSVRCFFTTSRRRESSMATSTSSLPHLTAASTIHIIPVAHKSATARLAIARGLVCFSSPAPLPLVRAHALRKGDVLAVARIAGTMAVKKTSEWVPLCHGVAAEGVEISCRVVGAEGEGGCVKGKKRRTLHGEYKNSPESEDADSDGDEKKNQSGSFNDTTDDGIGLFGGVHIEARVQGVAKTGWEMEAMAGVVGAALTVVDMCKAVDRGLRIENVRLIFKEGGRRGAWREGDVEEEV